MSDTYEAIAGDAIRILFLVAFNPMPDSEIHKAADTLAARFETLGLNQ